MEIRESKLVVGICPVTHKKQFASYMDARKFARAITKKNKQAKHNHGTRVYRNVDNLTKTEYQMDKVSRSIYTCRFCGKYHFTSMPPKQKKIRIKQ